jgi:hypothetical protein
MKQLRRATRERVVLIPFGLAAISMLLAGACSFTLDSSITQCKTDQECQHFAGAICDLNQHVCVASHDASTSTPDAGPTADAVPSCSGPSGCFACTPSDESQILSHCTDSICVPFDNKRLTLWDDDGGLRPLPQ